MQADLLLERVTLFDGWQVVAGPVSIALAGGSFVRVGPGSLDHLAGPDTVRRDLAGAFVMPGFVDVHNHHAAAGRAAVFELQVPPGAAVDTILAAVAGRASSTSEGAWIVGGPWSTGLLNELNSPGVLARLDKAAGGRPVVLVEDSRHNRWASSAALRLAGILAGPHAHDEGVLLDAATGQPTGVLLERAGLLVEHALARSGGLSDEQHRAASAHGIRTLNTFGITAFQDAATSLETLRALHDLDTGDELTAWVVTSPPMNDEIFGFTPVGHDLVAHAERYRTKHHRPDFVKIFLDGVPPARTAAFLEPYLPDDEHGCHHCGTLLIPPGDLTRLVQEVAARGLSVKVHCAGDAAARAVRDATETLRKSGDTATRVHLAHGQFLAEADLPRLAELDVTADLSPFVWFPGVIPHAIEAVLPQPLAGRIQPARTLAELGTRLAIGSDWPVCPTPNPWYGIHGLVTRTDPFRQHPGQLWADQALPLLTALRASTSQGAEAIGLGDRAGRIAAGYSADFLILDANPFEREPSALADMQVAETWFEGRLVHSRDR